MDEQTEPASPPTTEQAPQAPQAEPRPGIILRVAAGAWHVPAGFAFLIRRPRLWILAALPTLLGIAAVACGVILGAYVAPYVNQQFLPHPTWSAGLDLVIAIGLFLASVALGLGVGLAVAFLLSAPLLEILSRRVELIEKGTVALSGVRNPLFAFLPSFYPLFLLPWAGLLSLIPLVGPGLGLLVLAYGVAFEGTSSALTRTGKNLTAQRVWQRHFFAETMGFGLAGAVLLAIPFFDFLAVPAIVVGGTRLVLELVEPPAGEPAPPAEENG